MKSTLIFLSSLIVILAGAGSAHAFTLNSSTDPTMKGWADHNVTFHLNRSNCPSDIDSYISGAMAVWNNVGTSDLVISQGSDTTTTYAQLKAGTATDVPVIICDTNFSTDSGLGGNGIAGVALTSAPPTGGNMSYAFLLINVESGSSGNISSADATLSKIVIAHEMGHVLGLGHSADSKALMYYDASAKEALGLAQDDVDGITYLYPRSELGAKFMGCGRLAGLRPPGGPGTGAWFVLFAFLPLALWAALRRRSAVVR